MPKRNSIPFLTAVLVFACRFAGPAVAADPPKKIVAFGDSMTVGLYDDGDDSCDSPNYGYPGRLHVRLLNDGIANTVANEGRCGEETFDGVSRIDQALNRNADAAATIIMEGTNDLNNANIGVESMVFNIQEMARKAQVRRAWPVVVAPPPHNEVLWSDNARASFLATRLAEEAIPNNYDFLDLFEVFWSIDPDVEDYFNADGLHWNTDGYGLVGIEMVAPTKLALARVRPEPCVADTKTLCLSGGRYQVQVAWKTPVPQTGPGNAKVLTADTGFFWFFSENNIELVIKVLDGRDINGHYWVFYGALSDVEYTITVTDSATGRRRIYKNPQGSLASVGDITAFAEPPDEDDGAQAATTAASAAAASPAPAGLPAALVAKAEPAVCVPSATLLCLNNQRFAVSVRWKDPQGMTGAGTGAVVTGDTGDFWFFSAANIELVLKVLDGRAINGHYWIFFGSLSDVEFHVEVTDVETGKKKTYDNPAGKLASVADIVAFEVPATPPPPTLQ